MTLLSALVWCVQSFISNIVSNFKIEALIIGDLYLILIKNNSDNDGSTFKKFFIFKYIIKDSN